jgi:hypothetical protein
MNIQYSNDENQNQEFNQAKIEYDRMTSFHEKLGTKLIWAIGILFTVFGFLFYSSFKDMKEEMKNEVKEIKEKAKEAKQDYDKDLEDVKVDAKEILARNKEISDFQIQFLKEDVKSMALSSSRNRIDEILNSPNVQALVEQRTRKEVAEKLNEVVQEETAKTREVFDYLPRITIAYDQIRQGSIIHLWELDSLSKYSKNIEIRKFTKKLLLQKGEDYDDNNPDIIKMDLMAYREKSVAQTRERNFWINYYKIDTTLQDKELTKLILGKLKLAKDPYELSVFFSILRQITGQPFSTFDTETIYDWYSKNYK